MELLAARRRDRAEERLAQQRMSKPIAGLGLLELPCLKRIFERTQRRRLIELARALHPAKRKLEPDHRRRTKQRRDRLAEPIDTRAHGLDHVAAQYAAA